MNIIYSLLAAVLAFVSITYIFLSWKESKKTQYHYGKVLLAWIGILLSLPLWCAAVGAERGVIAWLCTPALFAWLLVLKNITIRNAVSSAQDNNNNNGNVSSFRKASYDGWINVVQHLLRFIVTIVLSCFASLFFCVAFTKILNFQLENAMAFSVLMLPFVWGVAAWWAASDDRFWRPAMGLSVITVIGLLIIIY